MASFIFYFNSIWIVPFGSCDTATLATPSVANVENAHHSTRLLAQTTLRNMLGTHNLHEILSDRESISNSMQVVCTPFPLPTP